MKPWALMDFRALRSTISLAASRAMAGDRVWKRRSYSDLALKPGLLRGMTAPFGRRISRDEDSVAERTGFELSVPFVELPDDQLPGGFLHILTS
jgi:hypothetical protein